MKQLKNILTNRKLTTGLVIMLAILLVGTASNLKAEKETKSKKGYLGVSVQSLDKDQKEELNLSHGVEVIDVSKGQAAEKAGIEKGDVILFFNGEKIRRSTDLVDAVRDCAPDSKVTAQIFRDGKKKDISVTVGAFKEPKMMGWVGKKGGFFPGDMPFLGVHLQKMNADLAKYFGVKEDGGALILQIEEDSPAEKAGLKSGDVIVKIDDESVSDPKDVSDIIANKEKGDKVTLHVMRHNKNESVTAELDERVSPFKNFRFFGDNQLNGMLGKEFHLDHPGVYFYKFKEPGDEENEEIIIEKELKKKLDKKEKHLKDVMKKHDDHEERIVI